MTRFCILVFFLGALLSCKKRSLFESIPASHSGVNFNNLITENDSINPINNAYVYNGGGVGVGDFNNDGLPDLYFSGNMVSNKLYLNKGNFRFEDVTEEAGVSGLGRWGRGVAVIDINNDGLPDIYVCNSMSNDSAKRQNLLYINQGTNKNGVPVFKEEAKEYGLDIRAHSTMASFFDYDNDGDLDMYLTVNRPDPSENPNSFRPVNKNGTGRSVGRIYRNDWDPKLGHGVYHDVSLSAGIKIEGYGHAATIADINQDGWKDIYVTNDFLSSNILYINNHNGTFTDRSKEYFKHTSLNAMGQDIQDINNDGMPDVVELDMNPEDNYRKKMMMMPNGNQMKEGFDHYGYQYQYVRNTLQVNQGPRINPDGSAGAPAFSEIGFLSGMAQTDWSWAPVVADFDNDGYRDIIITNGNPHDVTDHDFVKYRSLPYVVDSKKKLVEQIPAVKIHNYAFKNNGDLQFTDVSAGWGFTEPTFSNGAVNADLNNDGTLDVVINNIDDKAMVYKNTIESGKSSPHYLNIKFKGGKQNINGIGAWTTVYYDKGLMQIYENNPYRGYLSSILPIAHFGLGKSIAVDSVVIQWPNLKKQILTNVRADQTLVVKVEDAHQAYEWPKPVPDANAVFTNVTPKMGIHYFHMDTDKADFNIQKLLPHKLSEYAPALAAGDINGDGLDDIVIGGNKHQSAQVLLQQKDGTFIQRDLVVRAHGTQTSQDAGIIIFDANNDGAPDIYIASGGYMSEPNTPVYQDRLYINDGKGNFSLNTGALPQSYTSKMCVRAFDFNHDGKTDLLISGRVEPWRYPKPVSCFILRNDTKGNHVKFTDVTAEVAPSLQNIGLVSDALCTDFNNDGTTDLILAGEWMPVKFLKNINGKFTDVTATTGTSDKTGWWNSIVAGDFRHVGRMDYIIGNTGLNTLYKADEKYPVYVTAGDFDHRDRFDAFLSLYLPGKDGVKREYPENVRDDAFKQMISLRSKFKNYHSYAEATMSDLLDDEQRKGAIRLKAIELRTCYYRNDGNGKFSVMLLPIEAQFSVVNGMIADDFDGDGNSDVLINGNDYGTNASIGRYDASDGLLLKGDGKGGFKPLSILQSGVYLPGNGKALVKLQSANKHYLVAASEHLGPLKMLEIKHNLSSLRLLPHDQSAIIINRDGTITKQEFYNGSSFLSQSARFMVFTNQAKKVIITDDNGKQRTISLP